MRNPRPSARKRLIPHTTTGAAQKNVKRDVKSDKEMHGKTRRAGDSAQLGGFFITVEPAEENADEGVEAPLGEAHVGEEEVEYFVELVGDVGGGDGGGEGGDDVVVSVGGGHGEVDGESRGFVAGGEVVQVVRLFLAVGFHVLIAVL